MTGLNSVQGEHIYLDQNYNTKICLSNDIFKLLLKINSYDNVLQYSVTKCNKVKLKLNDRYNRELKLNTTFIIISIMEEFLCFID